MSLAERAHPGRLHPLDLEQGRRERRLTSLRPLVVDAGCDIRLRGFRTADPVRVALLEWLPLSPGELVPEGDGGNAQPVAPCLASLVRPPTIWPFGDALEAARHLGCEHRLERVPLPWLVRYAQLRVNGVHLTRVRTRAARIAGQLPLTGPDGAGSLIEAKCALIEHDDAACASIAALALARYALSRVVAREARVLRLP